MRGEDIDRLLPGLRLEEPGALEDEAIAEEMAVRVHEPRVDDAFFKIDPAARRKGFLYLRAPSQREYAARADGHGFGLRRGSVESDDASRADDEIDVSCHDARPALLSEDRFSGEKGIAFLKVK